MEFHRCFGGRSCLHLQVSIENQVSNEQEEDGKQALLLAYYLLGILLDPEDGVDTFLQNICELISDYTESHPRR
jgi:hypothetical protein